MQERTAGAQHPAGEVLGLEQCYHTLMEQRYNPKLIPKARENRANMTPAERKLWFEFLRQHAAHFRKQRPFKSYIVDFYCAKAKLVIELDGEHHFTPEGQAYDAERTGYLQTLGLHVIRFSNAEVLGNFEGVCSIIEQHLAERLNVAEGG